MADLATSLAQGSFPVAVVDLSEEIVIVEESPVLFDNWSDIWMGNRKHGKGTEKVALRMPRQARLTKAQRVGALLWLGPSRLYIMDHPEIPP
jgi:hypothetical protein